MEEKELTRQELYCMAKIFQSVLFSPDGGMFYGCRFCKIVDECAPDKKPHDDMIFDRIRVKLQEITAVDLSPFSTSSCDDKFLDVITKTDAGGES